MKIKKDSMIFSTADKIKFSFPCSLFISLFSILAPVHAQRIEEKKEIIVAAHYASWYRGPVDGSWFFNIGNKIVHTAYTPLLGYYNNLNYRALHGV